MAQYQVTNYGVSVLHDTPQKSEESVTRKSTFDFCILQ